MMARTYSRGQFERRSAFGAVRLASSARAGTHGQLSFSREDQQKGLITP